MSDLLTRITAKIRPQPQRRTKPVHDPVQAEEQAHEEDRRLTMSDMIVRALSRTQWKPLGAVLVIVVGALGYALDRMPTQEDVRAAVREEVQPLREQVKAIELELAVEKALRESK